MTSGVRVLIDTAAWIQHGRGGDPGVRIATRAGIACTHDDVVGEILLGCGPTARATAARVAEFPRVAVVAGPDLHRFIVECGLGCTGVGLVDAGLLAACRAQRAPTMLYTRDRRLAREARRLGLLWEPPEPLPN